MEILHIFKENGDPFLIYQCENGHIFKRAYRKGRNICPECFPDYPRPKGERPPKRSKLHPLYYSWRDMKERCYSPKNKKYHRYGGRGIKVCERWKSSFSNFLADMGERPPGTSLDRINNDGDYEPSNCRWATRQEQAQNTSRNVHLTIGGQTKCLMEWSRQTGIDVNTIKRRKKAGYTDEEIFIPLSKCFKPQMVERESG